MSLKVSPAREWLVLVGLLFVSALLFLAVFQFVPPQFQFAGIVATGLVWSWAFARFRRKFMLSPRADQTKPLR